MDYQTSTSSIKEIIRVRNTKTHITLYGFLCFLAVFTVSTVFAQTTTNPLMEGITISAMVLQSPGVRPDTPPIAPGPINMIDTTDVAIFKGLAYPESIVSLLKNGIVIAQIPSNQDGSFDIRVRNLNPGVYSFGLRAQDKNGLQSKLVLFTIFISSSVATIVEGIFMPPTITTDKIIVKKGEQIIVGGSSAPNAVVRLSVASSFELLKKVEANASGTWSYSLDSKDLDMGDYNVKAKSLLLTDLSSYSEIVPFSVGTASTIRPKKSLLYGFRKRCDLNDDGRVNLLDFSIMAFWYKRSTFPPKVDLNSDNRVNLTDLSILAYCWTG